MSIMIDARLRLLEARVAEIERRLDEVGPTAPGSAEQPTPKAAVKRARQTNRRKASKQSRKTP